MTSEVIFFDVEWRRNNQSDVVVADDPQPIQWIKPTPEPA